MRVHKRPLNRSITFCCVAFIILLCVLLNITNLHLYRKYVYADYRGYIADILDYTLAHIDADDLRACVESGEESEKYRETLLFMDDLMNHFSDIHYFYAILPLNTEDTGNTMSVLSAERYYDRYVDTEGNLYLGWISDDEFDAETAAQFFEILNGDRVVYFEEKTEWGTDYTGALPILDSAGQPVAVLAVDIDISFIRNELLNYALANIGVIAVAGLGFICVFLFWSRRNITQPIRKLEQSAVGFVDHSHGQRDVAALTFEAPVMTADNEIKALSDAVVKMTADMRDYVTDIISAEEKAANMQELAHRDTLTGIRNKTAYDNEIRRVEAKLADGERDIGLAIVDLNFLKKINDSYGHDKGDIALRAVSRLICTVFDHSPVFRIGGDEFAVLLRGHDYRHYAELEARFNAELERLAAEPALEPWERISAAIGAAFYDPERDDSFNALFMRADHVMYDRKKEMKAARS